MVKPGRTKQGMHSRTSVDQARKSDRAKELKKHKKERANIRLALAKSGSTRVENIEKLLDLERQLCGLEEARFHENVLRQKQKVLLASFDKSRAVFLKSDKPEDKASLDRLNETLKDYYTRCSAIRREADMLAIAKATVVSDIPMPMAGEFTKETALQPMPYQQHRGSRHHTRRRFDGRRALPPGVPVGLPPDFSDSDDDREAQDHDHVDDDDLGHVFIPSEISNSIAPVPPPAPVMMPLRGPPLPPPPIAPFMGKTVSAAPVLNNRPVGPDMSTIAAQPQLRDLKGESTSLVPAQLRRAKEKKSIVPVRRPMAPTRNVQTGKTTDEAYDDFMKELDGLL
ncbi:hypothetical protein PFISCL1PPCAC_8323 [Pristionchus fissidentatus]|uniref:Uncharacterized protein n=1 Tax=Pristionchus fissidentatus TaxID=1538716 RepID=A0AAV5VBG8_9BILA|nr:hypothetical protein PFISCL1PPCAC_8323 [Pristionchus fissidentatus]